jgi:hypothetical protein
MQSPILGGEQHHVITASNLRASQILYNVIENDLAHGEGSGAVNM